MLKKLLCVYAILAFGFMNLQAEDNQTLDSTKKATNEVLILQDVEQKASESTEKNTIMPGALACDCEEKNCKTSELIEEIIEEQAPQSTEVTCGKCKERHLVECKGCKKKERQLAGCKGCKKRKKIFHVLACNKCK